LSNSEDGNRHGHGTSAEYEITNEHRISPPGNDTKGDDIDEDQQDGGEKN